MRLRAEGLDVGSSLGIGLAGMCGYFGYRAVLMCTITVRERGVVVRAGWRQRSILWSPVADVTLEPRRSDAGLRGRSLTVHLIDGDVAYVGAFFEREKSATQAASYLRRICEELNAYRRGYAVLST